MGIWLHIGQEIPLIILMDTVYDPKAQAPSFYTVASFSPLLITTHMDT